MRILIINHGIVTRNKWDDWSSKAERKVTLGGRHVYKFPSYLTPLLRRVGVPFVTSGLGIWVKRFVGFCRQLQAEGHEIDLLGHSNGCEIQRQAMVEHGLSFKTVTWLAPAVKADFVKNGLNQYLTTHNETRLRVHYSPQDFILSTVAKASRVATFGLLGYGSLGSRGAINELGLANYAQFEHKGFKHGDYTKENFLNHIL